MPFSRIKKFTSDVGGSLTIWNTTALIGLLSIGGLAVDTSNAWRVKTLLQNTAEASALAAALYIDDPVKAKSVAVEFARRNMPQTVHGDVVRAQDIEFGVYDDATGQFTPTNIEPDSVRVIAGRTQDRANVLSTYLLRLAGVGDFEVGRAAIAFPRWGGGGEETCTGAKIVASGLLDAGGNNTLVDGACVHGELGITTGGGDFFDNTVQLTSANLYDIFLGWVRTGSVDPTDLIDEDSKNLAVLPTLNDRFDAVWSGLWDDGEQTYSGDLLPDILKDASGNITVERVDQANWSVTSADLKPNKVYLATGNVDLVGDLDLQDVAIVARGSIVSTGNAQLEDVFFFAEGKIDFGGETQWGDKLNYCDTGAYNSYLLSKSYISLGGAGTGGVLNAMINETFTSFDASTSSAHGVVASAPFLIPGGAFKDTGGIYVETSAPYATLGGNMNITNTCDNELVSFYETTPFGTAQRVIGSTLRY